MDFLNVGGVRIPVAPGGGRVDWIDAVDRRRAFDNTYRASATGNAKEDYAFSTPPITRTLFEVYKKALNIIGAQSCSGDVLGGSENLVLQSENFGLSWGVDGTPVRTPADITVGGVMLDLLADDDGAALEGYKQTIAFTGNGVKALSLRVRQVTSVSSGFRIRDNSAGADRLLAALTWSGGLPVLTMTNGSDLGYTEIGGGVFRLYMATTSVTAANVHELGIFPASPVPLAGAATGAGDFGGVQLENSATPTPYVKTTTATVNTLSRNFCSAVIGWTPVKVQSGHRVVLDFSLHEV